VCGSRCKTKIEKAGELPDQGGCREVKSVGRVKVRVRLGLGLTLNIYRHSAAAAREAGAMSGWNAPASIPEPIQEWA